MRLTRSTSLGAGAMGGDLDAWIASMRNCELLPERDLKHLCEYVQELMLEESTVQPVQSPVTICGDIHGQFHDLLELFRNGGECPHTSYIFMVRRRRRASSRSACEGRSLLRTPCCTLPASHCCEPLVVAPRVSRTSPMA